MPMGTPSMMAPVVIKILPMIMGSIPNDGGMSDGDHSVPNKNLKMPILLIAGIPPEKRNTQMKSTDTIEVAAAIMKKYLATASFICCFIIEHHSILSLHRCKFGEFALCLAIGWGYHCLR